VKPQCRGTGVGKALFGELGKIAQERVSPSEHEHRPRSGRSPHTVVSQNCARIDWSVLKVRWSCLVFSFSLLKIRCLFAVEPAVDRLLREEAGRKGDGGVDGHAPRGADGWHRGPQKVRADGVGDYTIGRMLCLYPTCGIHVIPSLQCWNTELFLEKAR
jgi:hypothetical protein